MAFHSSWKGFLKISLVSIPVKAYSAVSATQGEIHLHQLHKTCHSRIKYTKTCPIHGPVPTDQIVSGYEYAKDQYVVVDAGELQELRGDLEKTVAVESLIPAASIDPIYFTDRTVYLVPDGRVGQKPYALIEHWLSKESSIALARRTLNGKDEAVMIRSLKSFLVMTVLNSAAQVKEPEVFSTELAETSVTTEEQRLANTLFEAFRRDEPKLSEFKNTYDERLTELVEAKVKGQTIAKPAHEEEPGVINLMEALKKSVASAKAGRAKSPFAAEVEKSNARRSAAPKARKRTG